MALVIKTAPALEPVSLAEAKVHLRVDSGTLADNLALLTSIAPGSHAIAAAYSLLGTAVEVSGYDAVVYLVAGTNGTNGTVDVKLQQSEDGSVWSDVASGAFTQVTEANDNAVQEKAYTGAYRYLRAVATVAVAACEFSVMVARKGGEGDEDSLIEALITAAREDAEAFQNRKYIEQTLELHLDDWPCGNTLELPCPPLISVETVEYYNTANVKATMSADDYSVDTASEPGRLYLRHGKTWPSTTLRPADGVVITYTAGYGDERADVPSNVKAAIKLIVGHLYEHREDVVVGTAVNPLTNGAQALLWKERVL